MTTSARDRLLAAIEELRSLFPDWRVGQLVANLTQAAGRDREGAIWEVEDDELLAAARRLIERNWSHRSPVAGSGAVPDLGGVNGSPSSTTPQPPRQVK